MTDRFQGFSFPAADLSEDVDLDVERRKEILFADASLQGWTHWQALRIPWNAPAEAAKSSYLDLVKLFHPDRYAGKRIGSYRARLTRSSTVLQRAGQVGELAERGKRSYAEGRFAQAAADLVVAAGLDPRNAEVAALAAEATRRATLGKVSDLLRRAADEEGRGRPAAALELYKEAVAADEKNVRAAAEAARASAQLGDVAGARTFADRALELGPRSGFAHEALGYALEAEGNKKEAKAALERAIELDPSLERAKQRLKKLRWGFLA